MSPQPEACGLCGLPADECGGWDEHVTRTAELMVANDVNKRGLDDSLLGRAVVICRGCKTERWYGYGPCRTCGAFLPGAEP